MFQTTNQYWNYDELWSSNDSQTEAATSLKLGYRVYPKMATAE